MNISYLIGPRFRIALGALLLSAGTLVSAQEFATKPLFVGNPVAPNLMFLIDNSTSMLRESMPDDLSDDYRLEYPCKRPGRGGCQEYDYSQPPTAEDPWWYSSRVNKVYYNPDVTYELPYCGTLESYCVNGRYPDSSYTAAWYNGYGQGEGGSNTYDGYPRTEIQNLTNEFRIDPEGSYGNSITVNTGGFYYHYNPAADDVSSCEADAKQDKCYQYVSMNDASPDQKKNFANWYSYYRSRKSAAKASIGEAFKDLSEEIRLGWGEINRSESTIDGVSVRAVKQGVRDYQSTHKEAFYDWLYGHETRSGTTLRRALDGAGEYYQKSDAPWRSDPTSSTSDLLECRQSAAILMTDGYGFDYGQSLSVDVGDADSTKGSEITNNRGDSFQYLAGYPFSDSTRGTIADVAMHYWKNDLRTDIDNYVPTTSRNPAFWQHMITYGVGLGVAGTITPEDAWAAFDERDVDASERTTAIAWKNPDRVDEAKLDDVLHAAVNGRGGFFNADDPVTFANELSKMLSDFEASTSAATGVSFDMTTVESGDSPWAFTAVFQPSNWSGDVVARPVGTENGLTVNLPRERSAATQLDDPSVTADSREVITYVDSVGKPFAAASAASGTTMLADLQRAVDTDTTVADVIAYLRGDQSKEMPAGPFRARGSRLGDIVHSTPAYVGVPTSNWPRTLTYDGYSQYVSDKTSRAPVIYAGSNDGMLHAFSAAEVNGEGGQKDIDFTELFAYVPGYLYSSTEDQGLHYLADPDYDHKFYVDLPLRPVDVKIKGRFGVGTTTAEAWRTILVGGSRTGAKGIFALDVTDPAQFNEASAGKLVLWEFTDTNLGYLTDAPIISLASWGNNDLRWTAFFGNGYGQTTTGLYMLDINGLVGSAPSSSNMKFIDLGDTGGMSSVAVLDLDGDGIADRVYGGDQQGNLWAVRDDGKGNWDSPYKDGNGNKAPSQPLFTATAPNGSAQPITAAPRVAFHPTKPDAGNEPNLLVVFGTGRYLYTTDTQNRQDQSVYGIWDKGAPITGARDTVLQVRTMQDTTVGGVAARLSEGDVIDYANKRGWYVDLPDSFERVITRAEIIGDFIFVNSMIPDVNPCVPGGTGWLMAFGPDGRTPQDRAFLEFADSIVGYKVEGIPSESGMIYLDGQLYRTTALSNAGVDVSEINYNLEDDSSLGRQGWREMFE